MDMVNKRKLIWSNKIRLFEIKFEGNTVYKNNFVQLTEPQQLGFTFKIDWV